MYCDNQVPAGIIADKKGCNTMVSFTESGLLKGFYKEKNLVNGNVLVYPYLDEFVVHDGKKSEEECWKENFDFSSEQLKKDNIKDSMIFMDPDVLNGKEYKACGNRQIFVNVGGSFYVSDK